MSTSTHGRNDLASNHQDSDVASMTFTNVFLHQHSVDVLQHLPSDFTGLSLAVCKVDTASLCSLGCLDDTRNASNLTNGPFYVTPISNKCSCGYGNVICREDLSCVQLIATVLNAITAVCNICAHALKLTRNGNTVSCNRISDSRDDSIDFDIPAFVQNASPVISHSHREFHWIQYIY